jgi:hemerythrin HHE cation binding domain-containing protein
MPRTEHSRYQLLDDEGRPSFLSHFLASHRAFRRDAARFPVAVRRIGREGGSEHGPGRSPDVGALRRHWGGYQGALAYHHDMEDELLFPQLRSLDPALGEVIDELVVQHHEQDGTIAAVEEAMGRLPAVEAVRPASLACDALAAALDRHFDVEEEHLVPVMRARGVEPEADGTDEEEQPGDTVQAFVMPWVADGLDDDVVTALLEAFPPSMRAAFPGWQADYADLLSRWWW